MKLRSLLVIAVTSLTLFTGCETYRMGLSKAEWQSMTLRQQSAFREQHFRDGEELHREVEARLREIELFTARTGSSFR